MLYLANPSSPAIVDVMLAGKLGMIETPKQGGKHVLRALEGGVPWAADNGCFSDAWDPDYWWAWLNGRARMDARGTCLFATAPDVVGDAEATWKRAAPWLPRMRDLGYKVAYVAQDGLRVLPWHLLDVLFIGGSTLFKIGPEARPWIAEAVARGVPVHMGRVNSERRYRFAHALGCSTVDGTYLTFGPDQNLPAVLAWQRHVGQLPLFQHTHPGGTP